MQKNTLSSTHSKNVRPAPSQSSKRQGDDSAKESQTTQVRVGGGGEIKKPAMRKKSTVQGLEDVEGMSVGGQAQKPLPREVQGKSQTIPEA